MLNNDRYYLSLPATPKSIEIEAWEVKYRCQIAELKAAYYEVTGKIKAYFGDQEAHQQYCFLRDHHIKIADSTSKAYFLFQNNLLNPSVNGPNEDILFDLCEESGKQSSQEEINKIFENTKYKDQCKATHYLADNRFSGICLSQSLKFVKDVLDCSTIDDLTANQLIECSDKHKNGSDKQTVRLNKFKIGECNEMSVDVNILNEKLKKININEIMLSARKMVESETLVETKESKINLNKSTGECLSHKIDINEIKQSINNVESVNVRDCIAEFLNLIIKKENNSNFNICDNFNEKINSFCTNLSTGTYIIRTGSKNINNPGHVISYIKQNNDSYLRDPNLGLVRIPHGKEAEFIANCLKNINHEEIYHFYKCEKQKTS